MNCENKTNSTAKSLARTQPAARRSSLKLAPEEYAEDMAAFELDEDQARECLQILWGILIMCADLELGLDPVSLICGQNSQSPDCRPIASPEMIKSWDDANKKDNKKEEL